MQDTGCAEQRYESETAKYEDTKEGLYVFLLTNKTGEYSLKLAASSEKARFSWINQLSGSGGKSKSKPDEERSYSPIKSASMLEFGGAVMTYMSLASPGLFPSQSFSHEGDQKEPSSSSASSASASAPSSKESVSPNLAPASARKKKADMPSAGDPYASIALKATKKEGKLLLFGKHELPANCTSRLLEFCPLKTLVNLAHVSCFFHESIKAYLENSDGYDMELSKPNLKKSPRNPETVEDVVYRSLLSANAQARTADYSSLKRLLNNLCSPELIEQYYLAKDFSSTLNMV